MRDCPGYNQKDFEEAAERRLGALALELELDSFQAVWLLHQAALAARQHLERAVLTNFDLTWTQFEVLWQIWLFGEQEPRCIARDVGLSKSATTNITSELEMREYLVRRPSTVDKRRVYFKISRRGNALMKRLFPPFNHAESEFSANLDAAQKRQLAGLLRQLLEIPTADGSGQARGGSPVSPRSRTARAATECS